jgi:hypothetical protein
VLAAHLRWYQRGLHNHHVGEDELLWPLLHARADLQSEVVLRMEAQHERVAASLDQVMLGLPAWQASARTPERDRLVAALTAHRAVVLEHLDDEEAHLLPVAARHLTRREWDAQGEHFLASTPKRQLLILLGAVLEDADASERASVLAAMPVPARLIWQPSDGSATPGTPDAYVGEPPAWPPARSDRAALAGQTAYVASNDFRVHALQ